MTTDEEYLDNLLKSLTENEQQIKTMEETLNEMTRSAANGESFTSSSKDIGDMQDIYDGNDEGDMVFDSDLSNDDQTILEEEVSEEASSDDIFADFFAEALSGEEDNYFDSADSQTLGGEADAENSVPSDDSGDWQSGIDDLLAKADEKVNVDVSSADMNKMDVTDLIDHMENADDDLAEISGLLKNEDNSGNVDEDMLALLEGGKENSADNGSSDSSADMASENEDAVRNEESTEENKPAKKGFFSKEKKEKKKKDSKKKEEGLDLGVLDEKPSLLMKFLDFLTREEEDNSESDEILDKINKENEKKQKKEEKKRKKTEKKKGKVNADTDEDAAADTKKKKKEKKKKEKKEKNPDEVVKEKPVKVLSRKNLLVLIAACATLLGSIFALSTFLTEYSDRQNARQAFYNGDYEEVYRLFYDKNLGSSDSVIYNKVKIVLTIERKLESYKNNLTLNRELEAVDALMQGVGCYQNLQGVDEYDVRSEVDAVYREICGILENNYGITIEKALEINAYDNDTYTRVLDSIINGTEFVMPGEEVEEVEEKLPPQDILPEEEDIISY